MTTQNQLENARNAVGHVLAHHQAAYCNIMALRSLYADKAAQFAFTLSNHPGPEPLALGRCLTHIYSNIRENNEFINVSVALAFAEKDAVVIESLAIMEPLIGEVQRLEALILDERAAYAAQLAAIEQAEAAALEKARVALEKDPAVAKLREQAESLRPEHIEPPAPFRGRVKLEPALV